MLNEGMQQKLSQIVPIGMTDLPIHLHYRNEIEKQQSKLDYINSNPLKTPSNHLEMSLINEFISSIGVERYGVSEILEKYKFKNADLYPDETNAIVLVIPIDYQKMQSVPSLESATAILQSYFKAGEAVVKLTKFLRSNGIQATGHHPMGDSNEYHHLLFPPHAVNAGLGEKGRTGLFIDHELGPLVRLGIVTTTLTLPRGCPVDRGINAFCHRCKYCAINCPPSAIPDQNYLVSLKSGIEMEFDIKGNRCIKYFSKHNSCGKCLVYCVLAKSAKFEIKKRVDRIEKWYHKWVISGKLKEMYVQEGIITN